jgi:hypothetical protein
VSRFTVNQLLGGRRAVTPEMALRLGHVLDTSAEMWLKLQAQVDLYEARRALGGDICQADPTARTGPGAEVGGSGVNRRIFGADRGGRRVGSHKDTKAQRGRAGGEREAVLPTGPGVRTEDSRLPAAREIASILRAYVPSCLCVNPSRRPGAARRWTSGGGVRASLLDLGISPPNPPSRRHRSPCTAAPAGSGTAAPSPPG